MDKIRIIEVKESVFSDNNKDADRLRKELKEQKTFLLNLMSSPGSGKTTFLKGIASRLKNRIDMGVMEADIDSDVDELCRIFDGALEYILCKAETGEEGEKQPRVLDALEQETSDSDKF